MVLIPRNTTTSDMMPQTVPTAFTPPFDYSNFADSFDLSLLPGEDFQPVSPSTQLYSPNPEKSDQPKIFTTYYPSSPESESLDFAPDFNKLLGEEGRNGQNLQNPIYLDVPLSRSHGSSTPISSQNQGLLSPNDQFLNYRDTNFYPSSPEYSIHTSSPGGSIYSKSPCDELLLSSIKQESPFCSNSTSPLPSFSPLGIKEENYLSNFNSFGSPVSPANSNYSNISSPEQYSNKNDVVLESIFDKKQIKQENTVDFSEILEKLSNGNKNHTTLKNLLQKPTLEAPQIVPQNPKDHQLLRSVLRDTSFQKRHNLKPIDLPITVDDIKMEDIEEDQYMEYSGQITRETIDPVLNLAIEQMRKDVDSTCSILGISADPSQWTEKDVFSWLKWTSQQYGCAEPVESNWQMTGQNLLTLTESDFVSRAEQGGNLLYAQLEIWKAAYSDHDYKKWIPESISSNASSGDISEDEDEEPSQPQISETKPTTSRGGSHIHLWQFLKDLLSNPETNGTCIRWLDRTKGVFKIEDSVKVARLWGKRKNRPAMNYDKLSRSIRQYYKKGIMKKTERSQRLVYQFCHPYCL